MRLAEEAGFFPAVFLTTPNPMLSKRPDGDLGPRYTIVYTMPGPNNDVNEIRQDLYPYATPTPVTYVESGQRYFTTERTVGGWYVASQTLGNDLVAVGLPESPPQGEDGGDACAGESSARRSARRPSAPPSSARFSCAPGVDPIPRPRKREHGPRRTGARDERAPEQQKPCARAVEDVSSS